MNMAEWQAKLERSLADVKPKDCVVVDSVPNDEAGRKLKEHYCPELVAECLGVPLDKVEEAKERVRGEQTNAVVVDDMCGIDIDAYDVVRTPHEVPGDVTLNLEKVDLEKLREVRAKALDGWVEKFLLSGAVLTAPSETDGVVPGATQEQGKVYIDDNSIRVTGIPIPVGKETSLKELPHYKSTLDFKFDPTDGIQTTESITYTGSPNIWKGPAAEQVFENQQLDLYGDIDAVYIGEEDMPAPDAVMVDENAEQQP